MSEYDEDVAIGQATAVAAHLSYASRSGGSSRWWHAYGGVMEGLGCYQLVVVGPAEQGPDVALDLHMGGQPYLASWDHEPTDLEKETVTPREYRDEFGPLAHTIPDEDGTYWACTAHPDARIERCCDACPDLMCSQCGADPVRQSAGSGSPS